MTTARDVIAEIMCDLDNNLLLDDIDREIADLFIERLCAAPEPVRMELARQLLPDMKSYAQFKAEAQTKGHAAALPPDQHEALMMAMRKLEFISRMEGSYHTAYATFSAAKHHAEEAVKIVRAAGIDTEEKT